ncbi:hypothetical protein DFR74_106133 [Nocardia puris]|uniref:Uncharacterized protein n=1 Tax=Nocardia puris TaxID=208602 RepID=A0A366DLY6_9NOCA|nr:hypothetical protein DFR74_106133 [Nocardia puris]
MKGRGPLTPAHSSRADERVVPDRSRAPTGGRPEPRSPAAHADHTPCQITRGESAGGECEGATLCERAPIGSQRGGPARTVVAVGTSRFARAALRHRHRLADSRSRSGWSRRRPRAEPRSAQFGVRTDDSPRRRSTTRTTHLRCRPPHGRAPAASTSSSVRGRRTGRALGTLGRRRPGRHRRRHRIRYDRFPARTDRRGNRDENYSSTATTRQRRTDERRSHWPTPFGMPFQRAQTNGHRQVAVPIARIDAAYRSESE